MCNCQDTPIEPMELKRNEGITNDFMISSTESLEKHSLIVDCLKGK